MDNYSDWLDLKCSTKLVINLIQKQQMLGQTLMPDMIPLLDEAMQHIEQFQNEVENQMANRLPSLTEEDEQILKMLKGSAEE
jgi:hypothetical protein